MGGSCCACSSRKTYDVFLNFRGEDTRDNFISHLREALNRKKIKCYTDDVLERGNEISPTILKAIKKSKVSLIIFSSNYVSSTWCLDELIQIIKCKEKNGQIVIPVFYGVDPSDVRKQAGNYELKFKSKKKVQAWRTALKKSSNISGRDSRFTRPESKLVEAIVEDVMKKLNRR